MGALMLIVGCVAWLMTGNLYTAVLAAVGTYAAWLLLLLLLWLLGAPFKLFEWLRWR